MRVCQANNFVPVSSHKTARLDHPTIRPTTATTLALAGVDGDVDWNAPVRGVTGS